MKALGFDPGVSNFAYAVYDSGVVLDFGWVDAHDNGESDWKFLNSVVEILDRVRPEIVAIERFAFRKEASVESEAINIMIGKLDLIARLRGYEVVKIMPAHWKVKFKTKDHTIGSKYLFPDVTFDAVHQADAAAIAKYVVENRHAKEVAANVAAIKAEAKAEKKAAKALAAMAKSVKARRKAATAS